VTALHAELVATELGFVEGPVVRDSGIVCTSIDRGYVYELNDGRADIVAVTGGGPNGAAEGRDGTLFISQNGGRRPGRPWPFICGGVQLIRPGGSVHWLTQDPISPNDLCFGADGALYVTDPTRRGVRDDGRLWRCDPVTGESELLCSLAWYPNGIGFGIENDALFVASTGERRIVRFPLVNAGIGDGETFASLPGGLPDGFAFDLEGNLAVAAVGEHGAPGEIQTFDPNGVLIDRFRPGPSTKYTNVALAANRDLFITDSDAGAVLVVRNWPSPGLPLHPFRASSSPVPFQPAPVT
jgi:gluconolactonase